MSLKEREIEAVEVAEQCETCGIFNAPMVKEDGQWECYNCGAEVEDFEVAR